MRRLVTLLALIVPILCAAQDVKTYVSPEVRADRKATFRLYMPNAKKVTLGLEGKANEFPLVKGENGIWSVTVGPLDPNYYGYWFNVDGGLCLDPLSLYRRPNILWQSDMVLIPGDPPEPWELQDVPHGELHHHFFKSKAVGAQQDYWVYTPPNYPNDGPYPVLYLLHGYSDFADGWFSVGMANNILDNLIAGHKVKPMVLVAPLAYGGPLPSPLQTKTPAVRPEIEDNLRLFRDSLFHEIIPEVEKEYRVKTGPENRAITGLSMGADDSFEIGLNHPEMIAYIAGFSPGFAGEDSELPNLARDHALFKRVMVFSGQDDKTYMQAAHELTANLRKKGVAVDHIILPGMHEWPLWRKNLVQFCEEIFK
jgi:enterochelin esterase family protein